MSPFHPERKFFIVIGVVIRKSKFLGIPMSLNSLIYLFNSADSDERVSLCREITILVPTLYSEK